MSIEKVKYCEYFYGQIRLWADKKWDGNATNALTGAGADLGI
jgi:hypothetical protein